MIDQGQDSPGLLQQHLARGGKPDAVAAALRQGRADHVLKPPDLLAQRGLGDKDLLRGLGEGAGVGDRYQVPQMPWLQTLMHTGSQAGQLIPLTSCLPSWRRPPGPVQTR